MTLRNAFENLAVETKQDAIIALLDAINTILGTGILSDQGQSGSEYWKVQDDNNSGEVLPEQIGSDSVLTFNFSSPVNLIQVESQGLNLISRVDPFGGTPSANQGWPCRDEIPTYFPVIATTVKVYSPTGATVNVMGYRK